MDEEGRGRIEFDEHAVWGDREERLLVPVIPEDFAADAVLEEPLLRRRGGIDRPALAEGWRFVRLRLAAAPAFFSAWTTLSR